MKWPATKRPIPSPARLSVHEPYEAVDPKGWTHLVRSNLCVVRMLRGRLERPLPARLLGVVDRPKFLHQRQLARLAEGCFATTYFMDREWASVEWPCPAAVDVVAVRVGAPVAACREFDVVMDAHCGGEVLQNCVAEVR